MDNYVVFLDSINRTIVGKYVGGRQDEIEIENPMIMAVSFGEKMNLQLIPVFFRELQNDKNVPMKFTYPRDRIIMTDIAVDKKVLAQYEAMCAPIKGANEMTEVKDG